MGALYNDIEDYAVEMLNLRINDGWLPAGIVTDEDIRTLCEKDLTIYDQVHLFAGIGGFPLACRIAGLPDDFPILTAGFPCQPFSAAGKRHGTEDNRYLWPQTLAAIKRHRPAFAILENVAGLASMALPSEETLMDVQVLTSGLRDYHYFAKTPAVAYTIANQLEKAGYSVVPIIVPACGVNAKHERKRIWFVAVKREFVVNPARFRCGRRGKSKNFPKKNGRQDGQVRRKSCGAGQKQKNTTFMADASRGRRRGDRDCAKTQGQNCGQGPQSFSSGSVGTEDVPDADGQRGRGGNSKREYAKDVGQRSAREGRDKRGMGPGKSKPRVGGKTDGIPHELDPFRAFADDWEDGIARVVQNMKGRIPRVKGLGNAIVPQVAAEIISLLMQAYEISPQARNQDTDGDG